MPKNKEGPVKSHQFRRTSRCQGNTLGWCCPSRTFLVLPLMGFGQERRGQSHVAGMWLPHLGARPRGLRARRDAPVHWSPHHRRRCCDNRSALR